VIDAGPGPWTGATQGDYNLLTHEVGHLVELASKNMHGSPAFGIWGDSKWCEIYIYDVYKGLGLESRATNAYNEFMGKTDNFPRANTAWFKNWFYPIYSQYGGAAVLNRYFVQLALYFRRTGTDYPGMNMGEFVHFWSGAAGVNLKALATTAFGWTSEYEAQFVKAQQDFPFTYNAPGVTAASLFQDINYGGYGVTLPAGRYTLTQLKAYGARNDDITAIRVTPGFTVTLYQDDNFSGNSITITADNPLLDASWNDRTSSVVISSLAPAATTKLAAAEDNLLVYPNPAITGGTLRVKIADYKTGAPLWLSLVDINKRIVLSQQAAGPVVNISTAHLSPGVYILVVTNGPRRFQKKLIIQ
ncbi:MAG TPA: T9SS type A sorting domain-containing protein, partial [Chitinophaga sp.]